MVKAAAYDLASYEGALLKLRKYAVLPVLLFFLLPGLCFSQSEDVVCKDGFGKFEAQSDTGIKVSVGAERNGSLAKRACAATLNWEKQSLTVAPEAASIDIDVFQVDLGIEPSVVAFQIKKSDDDASSIYQIYSLQKPSKLLRTITGGSYFNAADTDLDTRVEIWTNDAAVVAGFERLELSELDYVPTIVLRFAKGKLIDVSSEFLPYFDHQISTVRESLDAKELEDFKNSDGKLISATADSNELEKLHNLRRTKIKVLEIVWAYLYSGRDDEAWHALGEMWPASDLDRIHGAISDMQAHGIRAQVDSVSTKTSRIHWKKRAFVFDTLKAKDEPGDITNYTFADTMPKAILLRRAPPSAAQQALPTEETQIDLVIDSAGKVRSAKAVGKTDTDLLSLAGEWKFIPAFRDGKAVACNYRMAVSAVQ